MEAPKRMIYLQEVAYVCESDEKLIEEMLQQGLLHPRANAEDEFLEPEDLELIRMASRLHSLLGVNLAGVEVILNMRQRIEALQQRLRQAEQERQHYEHKESKGRIIEISED